MTLVPEPEAGRPTPSRPPPAPRLVIRVGVTGHRPNGLAAADATILRRRAHEILTQFSTLATELGADPAAGYAPAQPLLRLVSPVAEGSDRLVVGPALELGYELQCALPFARDVYEQDFASDRSRAEFRELLARATAVLELDGSREDARARERAYERVGRTVLRQCDVLLAIWDGRPTAGRGGTGQIVAEALAHEIPVVWIESTPSHAVHALLDQRPAESDAPPVTMDALHARLREQLGAHGDTEGRVQRAYYGLERSALWFRPRIFQALKSLLSIGSPRRNSVDMTARPPSGATGGKQARVVPPATELPTPPAGDVVWADRLADYYGDLYRSSFVANYLLAAFAVLFALLGLRHHWAITVELLVIATIIAITTLGQRNHWHWRWLNYRLLAEQLRQFRLLWPLGRAIPAFRVPAHAAGADPANLWVSWLYRARVREAGLVNALVDRTYLERCSRQVLDGIDAQARYHESAGHIAHQMHRRLHVVAIGLFAATGAACLLHLTPLSHEAEWNQGLTLLAAFLPACGAALAGIGSQGEFARVARRSEAMQAELRALATRTRGTAATSSEAIGRVAEEAAQVMIDELVDWQVIFRAKQLTLPA